jgi:phospholipid/cholesterol/gamma-HCH transport system substrate-binding protein
VIARRVSALALLVAAVALGVILLGSGRSPYEIRMALADAGGLRQGSPVAIGGQDVGTITMTVDHGRVLVDMKIDPAQAPVGRDATAAIASVNLLGQKRVELIKGNVHAPAPSGYLLPWSQVTVTPDLDQVLDVLTPDVRTRLGILINEAGQAFTGRRADFNQMVGQLPPDFNAGTALLHGIAADNHTLGDLVRSSDGFVSELASQRTQLNHAIDVFGQASATVQARRAQLAATLASAPRTLATMQTFLGKLQRTTVPLGPAADDIAATAPALDATLAQLEPFRQEAQPTLNEATDVAPELTQLAAGATPVVRRATPVVASLATFSGALKPISSIVTRTSDNLVAILQNWSRAIQFRDGLSHVFRGEATMTPQTVISMVNQLQQAGLLGSHARARHRRPARRGAHRTAGLGRGAANRPGARNGGSRPAGGAGAGTATATTPPSAGATGSGSAQTTPTQTTPSGGSGGGVGGSLASLLSYLLKP